MIRLQFIGIVFLMHIFTCSAIAQTTQQAESELTVEAMEIRKERSKLSRLFKGKGIDAEEREGVSVQFLLKLIHPTYCEDWNAIRIETVVDDTYKNLKLSDDKSRGIYVTKSNDEKALLFRVKTADAPSVDAEKLFIRGKLLTKIITGKETVASGVIDLGIGGKTKLGPYTVSVDRMKPTGESKFDVHFHASDADAFRILKFRVSTTGGKPLSTNSTMQNVSYAGRPGIFYANLETQDKQVKIELTYGEQASDVIVPFESEIRFERGKVSELVPANKTP